MRQVPLVTYLRPILLFNDNRDEERFIDSSSSSAAQFDSLRLLHRTARSSNTFDTGFDRNNAIRSIVLTYIYSALFFSYLLSAVRNVRPYATERGHTRIYLSWI